MQNKCSNIDLTYGVDRYVEMNNPEQDRTFRRVQVGAGDPMIAGLIFHETKRNNYRPESSRGSLVIKYVKRNRDALSIQVNSHTLVNALH